MNLLQMSISAGVMIAVVTIIRALAINRLPKKTFLTLWGIVLVRLFVPFSWPSPFSVYSFVNHQGVRQIGGAPVTAILPIAPAANDFVSSTTVSQTIWPSLRALIWGIGAALCTLYFAIAYIRCRREFRDSQPVKNSFAAGWLSELKCKRPITIRQTSGISAPLTYGIFRPVILMPTGTDWTDTRKLQYVLTHEYVHIRRFDGATKLLLTAALCIHWFNPLVWVMYVLSNRDIELSCDEKVVRTFGKTIKSAYALALIGMEEKKSKLTPFCNNFSKNAIEERIKAIMKIKKPSLMAILVAIILTVGVTTAFATSAVAENKNLLAAIANTAFTTDEYDKVLALQFDGYENMTVADFREKACSAIDAGYPDFMELIDRMYQDRQLSEMRYTNETASFLNNTLFSLIFENWKEVSFRNYIDSPYSGVVNDGRLEYTVTRTILGPNRLTVGEHNRTLRGIMDDLQTFIESKSSTELQDESGMNVAIKAELERLISKWESQDLKLEISYFYTPLTIFDTPGTNKIAPEDERGIPGNQQDYNSLLSLKTPDYKYLSVADFNDTLLTWATDHLEASERIRKDIVMNDFRVNLTNKEMSFVTLTFPVSNAQNTIKVLYENNGTPKTDPVIQYSHTIDEPNAWYMLWYQLSIQISDENKLTIGERDRYLSNVINGMQRLWSDKNLDELANMSEEVFMENLTTLVEQNSNNLIRIEIKNCSFQGLDERSLTNN